MTPSAPTVAKTLQQCVVDQLAAAAAFTGVTIVGRRKKNLVSDIEAAIEALGLCIFVSPGMPVRFNYAGGGPYADRYGITVTVFENPAINSKFPDAYELAELIIRELWDAEYPQAITGMNPLLLTEGAQPVQQLPNDDLVILEIGFETSLGLLPKVTS